MGVKKKKAKPSPKGGKLLSQVKKAKRSSLVKKLLAKANKLIAESVEAFVPVEGLPPVDVPVTSTEIKGTVHPIGTPLSSNPTIAFKKWKDDVTKQGFIDDLTAASQQIFESTKKGNAAKFYVGGPDGQVYGIEDVKDLKLVEIAGGPTPVGEAEIPDCPSTGFLHPVGVIPAIEALNMYDLLTDPKTPEGDIQAYESTMMKGAYPESLLDEGGHTVAKARKDAMEHYTMMVHALAGVEGEVIRIPKRKLSDVSAVYRYRLRQWWKKAHNSFCVLAEKARAQKKSMLKKVKGPAPPPGTIGAAMTAEEVNKKGKLVGFTVAPYQPLYTTPPIIPVGKDAIAEAEAKVGKLVGFKASDFVDAMGQPLYPGLKEQEAELTDWMNHTAQTILKCVQFESFDKAALFKVRSMISEHFDSTIFSGGVGPPALFKTLGKQLIVHRTGLRFWHYLELKDGKCSIEQVQIFNQVFPSEGLPVTPAPIPSIAPAPFNGPDKIATMQGIADWMTQVAQIIFDFIHWQHPCKEVLLEVRKYIENVYDEDLMLKVPIVYNVVKMIPKAGVVHRVGVRVRHMLIEKYGDMSDEADDLFAEIFPLPHGSDALVVADFADLMAPIAVKLAPTLIKTQEELKAAFGEPDMTNEQAKHVAIMLQKTKEYMDAHPEAAGVGPLDPGSFGVGCGPAPIEQLVGVQPMTKPPSAKVFHLDYELGPNKNGNTYPGTIWNEAVKKLQPKFSEEAEQDAKEQGLGEAAENILSVSCEHPGVIPEMDVNVVVENGTPYLVTTCNGKVMAKSPAIIGPQEPLTQKGLATLDRFGVVLKGA